MKRMVLILILLFIMTTIANAYTFSQAQIWQYALDSYWFLQVLNLVRVDIYDCTKIGLRDGRYEENNDIARWFTSRGYYNGLYVCSAILNAGLYFIASWWYWDSTIPKRHAMVFRKLYLVIISIAEMYAISTWKDEEVINAKAKVELHFAF